MCVHRGGLYIEIWTGAGSIERTHDKFEPDDALAVVNEL